jgi:hypothetical protein
VYLADSVGYLITGAVMTYVMAGATQAPTRRIAASPAIQP